MPTYLVWSGGDNSSGTEASGWAAAKTTLAGGLALATSNGDVIKIHVGHAEAVAADTTWTFGANISIICVDKDNSDALAVQDGSTQYLGHTSTSYQLTLAGSKYVDVYGLAFLISGSTSKHLLVFGGTNPDNAEYNFYSCKFYLSTTSTTARIYLSAQTAVRNCAVSFSNCHFKFGSTSQRIVFNGCHTRFFGGSIGGSGGSAPATLTEAYATDGGENIFEGVDLSSITGTLIGDQTNGVTTFTFRQCKLGSSVTRIASQTALGEAGAHALFLDCSDGDNHYAFEYYNSIGSVVVETGITAIDGAKYNTTGTLNSWKVIGTANGTLARPFRTPWISVHHESTSAITPYIEILRDGSTTAYQNNQVWAEFMFKGTSGSTLGTINDSDRMVFLGSAADQANGMGITGWNEAVGDPYDGGESAWSGKLAPSSSITPQETGDIGARICVVGAITVYVDPQIRGRT